MQKTIIQGVTSSLSALFIHDQVRFLEQNGYQVEVVCNNDSTRVYDGLNMTHIPFEREISLYRDVRSLITLTKHLRQKDPDIVIFSTPKASLLGMIAGYMAGTNTRVYAQWGLRLETVKGFKKIILHSTEKMTCMLSTHVIAVSESLADEMVSRKLVSREKIVRIGRGSVDGIDLDVFNPEAIDQEMLEARMKECGLGSDEFIIGYVGRLTKDKGINELVEAFSKLAVTYSHIRLLLVGDFEEADPVDRKNQTIIEDDLRIIHQPYTTSPEYYYSMMDVFAFPTYREGFGTVSVEAQAMHVPVITFDSTGARDTIIDGKTGLRVVTNDADGLADAIRRMIEYPLMRHRMGRSAREFVEAYFDRRIIREHVLAFYNMLGEEDDPDADYLRA
ncbi:glycosyltransferase family 4 protein [Salinicoccus roseus]|uniref:glycosyltransferase family 4 protein n=1 Tax=Salinicoccus roseus TaxID=45670 RepID=UPI0022FFC674|nr:glycosyltransferase family 4 protein [Salinicoccus roseus]